MRSLLSRVRSSRTRTATAAAALAALTVAGAAVAVSGPAVAALPRASGTTHYAVDVPLCPAATRPHVMQCFAEQRVPVRAGTSGAHAYTVPAGVTLGPAGGFTPADLASAYGFDPTLPRSHQLVAVIDWFNDPRVRTDLNTFDRRYHLPLETSTSFRVVNGAGAAAPLPRNSTLTSGEIALDVQAVRAVCHTCRILLVEASGPTDAALASAENTAVRLGATEVSNSFGGPEGGVAPAVRAAYDHPGVVITAASGDDGWYSWDYIDDTSQGAPAPPSRASFPATLPTVVAVGGTALTLAADGSRQDESVWNENGASDAGAIQAGVPLGASGGGCSHLFRAAPWQASVAGWSALGCGARRSSTDLAVLADPQTGFDVIDSYGSGGWVTVGGTSLASPIAAAMFALAGGAGDSAYPAASLYLNAAAAPGSVYDVITGGNAFCGTASTSDCSAFLAGTNAGTNNPNGIVQGFELDCSFPRDGSTVTSAPAASSECNASPGFDGPSGLGAPDGLAMFRSTAPTTTLTAPAAVRLHSPAAFTATATESLAGATVTGWTWRFGDGTADVTTTGGSVSHVFSTPGTYTVIALPADTANQIGAARTRITVGEPAVLRYAGPVRLRRGAAGGFSTAGSSSPNTGAHVTGTTWVWGDGTRSTGTSVHHRWRTTGLKTVRITLRDSTGVVTTRTRHVRVTD